MTVLRCPHCREPLADADAAAGTPCPTCGHAVDVVDGIPLLHRDPGTVLRKIEAAKASAQGDGYEAPHVDASQGPYRHHLRKRHAYVEKVLADYSARRGGGLTGLDLGCGDGTNLALLSRGLERLYGCDFSLDRLRRAKAKDIAKLVFLTDIADIAVLDNAVDVVFLNHVLEHVEDDGAALAEVQRIVKPGGLVVLGVPNEGAFFWQLAYTLQPKTRRTTDHVHFYTEKTLAQKCRAAGFRIEEVKRLGWGLPHWRLDAMVRGAKILDDLFEIVGRRLIPGQASSLYFVLAK